VGKYKVRPRRFIPALVVLFCAVGLIFWGAWSTLAWAKNNVLLHFLEVQALTQDEIKETLPVEGLLVKHEEPIKAPAPGQIRLLVQDGDRLRKGTRLAEISGLADHKLLSPRAGVFCTHLDNLENLLLPGMIDVLDVSEVEKINLSVKPLTDEVAGGQIIGKVVDNLQPLLIYIQVANMDEFEARSFKKDTSVRLIWHNQQLAGKVTQASFVESTLSMFVELPSFPAGFIHERRVQLDLVTRRLTGWQVPEEAIVFQAGKPGLYVVAGQAVCWVPVAVQDRLQGIVTIKSKALNSSVRFIKNPGWAREGVRLN